MPVFSDWSEFVQNAFIDTWIYDEGYTDEVDRFTQQWGALDEKAFLQVLSKGQGKERTFALFALTNLKSPGIETKIFPLLESNKREERWASAISLGRLYDARVFILLQDLLLESIQDYTMVTVRDEMYEWYHHQRCNIAMLLGAWGKAEAAPCLRRALQIVWQMEQQEGPLDGGWKGMMDDLHFLEDSLAYALGQLGAWGSLLHLELSPSHERWAMQHMILGHLQVKLKGMPGLLGVFVYDDELPDQYDNLMGTAVVARKKVKTVLAERFGLLEEEQAEFFYHLSDVMTERDREAVTK